MSLYGHNLAERNDSPGEQDANNAERARRAALDATPGCEGGAWCRCPKTTPCYPLRSAPDAARP